MDEGQRGEGWHSLLRKKSSGVLRGGFGSRGLGVLRFKKSPVLSREWGSLKGSFKGSCKGSTIGVWGS